MKTKYLLPSSWRIVGVILIVIFVPLTLWTLMMGDSFPILSDTIHTPWRFEIPSWGGAIFSQNGDGTINLDLIDEILGVGIICGLFIMGFSKLQIEDERIAQLRLESLQWGIYANCLIMLLCILFVYGGLFFTVMIFNIFTPLLIFVARFYWLLLVKPLFEAKNERSLI